MKLIAGTTSYSENPNIEYTELDRQDQTLEITQAMRDILETFPLVKGIVLLGKDEAVVYKLEE